MAYYTGGKLQWGGTITSPTDLARVIQGEAASPSGQFAVASTMWNRMQGASGGGYLGAGSGDVTQVVTPGQFNGWSTGNVSPEAQAYANALWAGQPPPGGSTGNAVFYAAPVYGNAAWASPGGPLFQSGTNIGGNYFSDRQGAPSANFQAPQYGAGTSNDGSNIANAGEANGLYPVGPHRHRVTGT